MFNLAKVARFAKLFLYSEIIDGKSLGVKLKNGLENEPVFNAIKVVSVDNGRDLRNDKPIFHEHGREQLLFHFDGFRKFFLIHKNHLVKEGKEKTTLTKVNAVLEKRKRFCF